MRFLFLLLFCFLLWTDSSAQSGENSFKPGELAVRTYRFNAKRKESNTKLPFFTIKVIDARFDSSKLGFIASPGAFNSSKTLFDVLKIQNGIARGLENYLNDYYINDSIITNYGLLIVLKKFWVTSTRSYDYQKQSLSTVINGESRIIAKWELYIFKEGEYLPFKRIDTLIESKQSVKQLFRDEDAAYYNREDMYSVINSFIEKHDYLKALKVFPDRQKKTLKEIDSLNNARFIIPILTDKHINKGVFLNFNNFRMNTPSVTHFNEKNVKYSLTRSDQHLTDHKDSIITNYWAYSTPKYTRVGPYGTETIFRTGNTFEFFVKKRIVSANGGGNTFNNHYFLWIPYQVDMETGDFY